jgi:hypothetical protein
MSVLALLLSFATAQDAPTDADEIVVLARRLEAVEVIVGRDPNGRFTCGMKGTSGNPRLDSRLCKTVASCVRKRGSDPVAVQACITSSKPRLLAQFRAGLARSRTR